jgi:glycosyltransferase involved in cell wall biosynthesis
MFPILSMSQTSDYKNKTTTLPDLSIVVLCYKSGLDVEDFATKIISILEANKVFDYEIVLVGNYNPGSNDNTPEVVKNLSFHNNKIFYTADPKPRGGMMGWDLRSGLDKTRGRYLLVIDGDGQMPIQDILRVYQKIKNENFDLVKTYRLKRGDNYWRKIISWCYNIVFNIVFPGIGSHDINSKPKILKREKYSLLNLSENGWCIDAEIMIQAKKLNFKIGEIPTVFLGLQGRRRSFVKFPAIFEFIKFLTLYRFHEWSKKV